MNENVKYTVVNNVGRTPENPSGQYEQERSYWRETVNGEQRTAYKEAVARCLGMKFVDFSMPDDEFMKMHEDALYKSFVQAERGGVSWQVSQDTWLKKIDAAASSAKKAAANLRNYYTD